MAFRTALGWALTGSMSALVPSSMRHVYFIRPQPQNEELLVEAVKEWWSTKSFGKKYEQDATRYKQDDRVISILEAMKRKVHDQYEVGQLWRAEDTEFPNNQVRRHP